MTEVVPDIDIKELRRWKRYDEYRPSGARWHSEVPAHWEVRRGKFLAATNPSKSEVTNLPAGTEVSFLPMEQVGEDGSVALDQTRPIEEVYQGFTYFRDGDVLIAKITPCFENGKGALVRGLKNGVGFGTTEFHVLRPNGEIDGRYFELVTRLHPFRGQGVSEFTGAAGQQRVPESFIRNYLAPVPPLAEQQAIVAFLDRETARINALIGHKERLITLLEEKRQAVISHAVTRGLDSNAKMKDSGSDIVGPVPRHWSPMKLKYLYEFCKRQGFPDEKVLSVYRDYGVIEKSTRDDNHNRTPIDLTSYQLVEPGDLVINKMKAWQGSLGISNLRGITSPDYVVYRSTNNEYLPYLHQLLRSRQMATTYHSISNGIRNDQWRVEPDKLEQIVLYLPPVNEQEQIAKFIVTALDETNEVRSRINDGIELLREYRTALVSAAVTGQIDVREEGASK